MAGVYAIATDQKTDDRTRLAAFTALLDRVLGKPKERREVSGEGGGAIVVKMEGMAADYSR
ncbi:MAG TPA: hypothetical protein VEA69_22385 [Tepidisphaeraceae bacterium]|nr:hypothetical protein [Tepidisphaeraceae bacterium]